MSGENPPPHREPIGLIGLGLMGAAMAERLLAEGFRVVGWDIDPGRRAGLRQLNGELASRADEVTASCRRIILSLPTLDVVADVLEQNQATLRAGQTVIDTSTGDPQQAVELGARLAGRGVIYLDATISGSSAQVRKREVVVMVGGPREAFIACQDLFCAWSKKALHIGAGGSGAKAKLVTNLVLGLNRAALAEGLALARALELDLEQALAVLRESMAYSRIMDTKGEKMVRAEFEPQAKLSQHRKDVELILAAGARAGGKLPLSQAHVELLKLAEAAGCGQLDNSAIIRAYEKLFDSGPAP